MNWFFIALAAPFLWALVNIADNYLVRHFSKKEEEKSSGALVLFSSLIGLVIAFFIWIFYPNVYDIPAFDKILLLVCGVLTVVWVILYLFSLEIEETSLIVPWFLCVPVFGYILGYIFLGETLSLKQFVGSAIIFVGLILISINFEPGKKARGKHVYYMFFACLAIAISGVIFKYVTVSNDFWVSSFWEYLGLGLTGLLIFILMPKYRESFLHMNKTAGHTILGVNITSEFVSVAGNLLGNLALVLAPAAALVFLVGSFQPAFVLILTIVGTKFFPHIIKEDLSWKKLLPKIIALAFVVLGSAILFL